MTVLFLFELSRVGYNLLVTSLGWLKGSGFLIGVMWVVVVVVVVVAAAATAMAGSLEVNGCGWQKDCKGRIRVDVQHLISKCS
jgi:uncharacterized membrane protein